MQSTAATVEEYLAELPEERREALRTIRNLIVQHLPAGYEEGMLYGMIGYYVPLSRYPTKNKQPLSYIALASQKNYMALYLRESCTSPDGSEWFRSEYVAAGKKLDMGKGCVRFKKLDDLPLAVVAKAVAVRSVEDLIAFEEATV